MGQTVHVGQRDGARWRPARPARTVGAGAVALAVVAGLLTGCGTAPAKEKTTVAEARGAVVVAPDGTNRPAEAGMTVPEGGTVRTSGGGSATLDTGGRLLYLGGSGRYVVGTGVTGELQHGAAVIDDRAGPPVRVAAGPVAVTADGGAVRVERGFSTRVGVFSGVAKVAATPSGAEQALPALYQVVVAGREIPEKTPLVLTDDDAERRVALGLVEDDLALTRLAGVLNDAREGRALVRLAGAAGLVTVAASSVRTPAAPVPPVSETALPVAIARAAVGSGGSVDAFATSYLKARDYRTEGASWGVVAHLSGTDAAATGDAIDVLLANVPRIGELGPGTTGTLVGTTGGGSTGTTTGPGTTGGSTGGEGTGGSGGSSGSGGSTGTGGSGGPSPSPSPSPSPGSLINDLMGTVNGLVPSPTPSPSHGGGTAPAPRPSCLLLGLVCSG